ncbi:AfsR/SARP family transcriptional regulator, partial [Catenulispora rubra]|uniref:AfsR/SARP family transcriptional regulator n=1 Tax=Catenulispora rubra TaxID=280293 RepID=UPI00189249A5
MRFELLGPLEVTDDGLGLPVNGPYPRAALTTLLLHRNQPVPVERLTRALWGDEPPVSATAALRNHMMRLRHAVRDPDATRIRTGMSAYEIRVAPGECDLDDFARGYAEGLRAAREERWAQASRVLTSALALWRGEPLADLPAKAEFKHHIQQLRNNRLLALERRIEADMHLGRHHEAGDELWELTAEHPLHEQFHRQLMLALYRSGRQAEALDVYAALRRTLKAELAIEPSADVRDLQQRILVHDPVLAPCSEDTTGTGNPPADQDPGTIASPAPEIQDPTAAPSHPEPDSAPIAQLPADVTDFTGRERETAAMVRSLIGGPAGPGRVPVVTVTGGGGLGKTTAAIHAAHQVAHLFPDGQLYADLRGTDPLPSETGNILGSLLSAFGIPAGGLPPGVNERAALFRTTLAGRRVLVVLDNARNPEQIRPLIPASEGCAVLVTSRYKLSGLAGARRVDLDLMPAPEASRLLELIIGADRTAAEPAAVASILESCAGLPLALRIAGARLADRPSWSVQRFATRLADRRRRLDELSVPDLAVRASFDLSYVGLRSRRGTAGLDADDAFRIATLIPATSFGAAEVAALLGAPEADVEDALEHLVDIHLLAEQDEGCYRYHDLIRSYASELLNGAGTAAERDPALRRLICWYAAGVEAASVAVSDAPNRLPTAEPEPGT